MEIDVATKLDLIQIRNEIFAKIEELLHSQQQPKEVMTKAEVMDYLGCSHNTLKGYRIKGLLHTKHVGRKEFYKRAEVLKMVLS